MNRRLIYAILIISILVLLVNYCNGIGLVNLNQNVLNTINLIAFVGFALFLVYKHIKFTQIDRKIEEYNPTFQPGVLMASMSTENAVFND